MNTPEEAIALHQKSINDRNLEEYIKTVIFPFTYQNFNGTAITVKTSDEYRGTFPPPWETMIKINLSRISVELTMNSVSESLHPHQSTGITEAG